jgi:hypothetical protein
MPIGSSEDLAKLAVVTAVLVVGLGAWVAMIYYSFRTVACLKAEVRLWRDAPAWNPFNHILRTAHLTEQGLKHRRRLIAAALTFVSFALIALGVAVLLPAVQ